MCHHLQFNVCDLYDSEHLLMEQEVLKHALFCNNMETRAE